MRSANFIDHNTDFPDIPFHVFNYNLKLYLYDKRNNINFFNKNMPHWFSNFYKQNYINIAINQIIRFNEICNSDGNFHNQIFKFLGNLFYNNNYPYRFLKHYVKLILQNKWQQSKLPAWPFLEAILRNILHDYISSKVF